ncbi:MAG: hypothetical protein HZB26_08995 [Candidatus Hydrogenedentes bacterium]|nr:hypothetical protein [Candidatus Hydrogenedentota bacterium]
MDRMAPCDNLQHMIAYSFCVIGQRAGDWRSVAELTPMLLLPAVAEEIPRNPYSDLRAHMARSRILDPLRRFGLHEFRLADEDGRFTDESDTVRKTPLVDRFLRFNL